MTSTFTSSETCVAASPPPTLNLDSNSRMHVSTLPPFTMPSISEPTSPLPSSSSPRTTTMPLPNPPFVFPLRPAQSSASLSVPSQANTTPSSPTFDPASTPSHKPARQPRGLPLPVFSFNPGASIPSQDQYQPKDDGFSFSSPPHTPKPWATPSPKPGASPSRPLGHGHRRGGSEFVGGSIRMGDSIMSGSPTKSEMGGVGGFMPPASRRLHMRNRSAMPVFSSTLVLQPTNGNSGGIKGNSAPASPADFGPDENNIGSDLVEKCLKPVESEPSLRSNYDSPSFFFPNTNIGQDGGSSIITERSPGKTRVGFSDTLEFIPRPLSMVSSDTSSTMTVRPGGHSLSGSISSVISTSTVLDRGQNAIPETATTTQTPLPEATTPPMSSEPHVTDLTTDSFPAQQQQQQQQQQQPTTNTTTPELPAFAPSPASSPKFADKVVPIVVTVDDSAAAPNNDDADSPVRTPKKWSFFGLDPFLTATANTSLVQGRPNSSSSSDSGLRPPASSGSSSDNASDAGIDDESQQQQPSINSNPVAKQSNCGGKASKKNKSKKSSWGGSILSRRAKSKNAKAAAAVAVAEQEEEEEGGGGEAAGSINKNNNESEQRTIVTPPHRFDDEYAATGGPSELTMPDVRIITSTPSPRVADMPLTPHTVDLDDLAAENLEPGHQMIDLDAALGPFNTPLPRNPEWEAAQKAAASGTTKRQLHSAQGMKGFSGPGMHYHRRTESAPEMMPFESSRSGLHKFASSSTMADVFEEEEEEHSAEGSTAAHGGIKTRKSLDDMAGGLVVGGVSTSPTVVEEPEPSFGDAVVDSGMSPFIVEPVSMSTTASQSIRSGSSIMSLNTDIAMGGVSTSASQSESVMTEFSADFNSNKDYSRLDIVVPLSNTTSQQRPALSVTAQPPVSPFTNSHASSFPSPRSPVSYDAQRISTAPSSVNDEENSFQSLLLGEPGPEVRISVDIPSLSSSTSTMTRQSMFVQNSPHFQHCDSGDGGAAAGRRPVSLSSTTFGRRRASLVSLSRLISSSHGERSKLSMEISPDATETHPRPKTSRSKRISRLVQFWKPKEPAAN